MAGTFNLAALREGRSAAEELAEALELIGVKFPSLRGDLPVGDVPLVQLGGATARVVRDLAGWIRDRA